MVDDYRNNMSRHSFGVCAQANAWRPIDGGGARTIALNFDFRKRNCYDRQAAFGRLFCISDKYSLPCLAPVSRNINKIYSQIAVQEPRA
jgi:hypothetical protein